MSLVLNILVTISNVIYHLGFSNNIIKTNIIYIITYEHFLFGGQSAW